MPDRAPPVGVVRLGIALPRPSRFALSRTLLKAVALFAIFCVFASVGALISAIQAGMGAETIFQGEHASPARYLVSVVFWLLAAGLLFGIAGFAAIQLRPRYYALSAAGLGYAALALVCWYFGAAGLVLWVKMKTAGFWPVVFGLAGFGAIAAGSRAFATGRQRMALDADTVMAGEKRAPILYLRSFAADEAPAPASYSLQERQGNLFTFHVIFPGFWTERREWSFEEFLCRALSEQAAVVALGRPGEELPRLGAARKYVPHERWQLEVSSLIPRSGMACLLVATSDGLLWEMHQALALRDPRCILLIVPQHSGAGAVWSGFAARLGDAVRLPATLPADALAVAFTPGWDAVVYTGKPLLRNYRQLVRQLDWTRLQGDEHVAFQQLVSRPMQERDRGLPRERS